MELHEMHGLLHEIKGVFPLSNYRLLLEFEHEDYRVVNLKSLLERGGVFAELRDPQMFRTVHVSESGTVEWDNGVDLDPDVLYATSVPIAIPKAE